MSSEAQKRWAAKRWHCQICGYDGAQGHRTRHLKSETHIRNAKLYEAEGDRYELKETDIEFAKFIARTTPSVLTGLEQAILLMMIKPELADIFRENVDGRLEREGITGDRQAYRDIRSEPRRSEPHLHLVAGTDQHQRSAGGQDDVRRVQSHRRPAQFRRTLTVEPMHKDEDVAGYMARVGKPGDDQQELRERAVEAWYTRRAEIRIANES